MEAGSPGNTILFFLPGLDATRKNRVYSRDLFFAFLYQHTKIPGRSNPIDRGKTGQFII
jgi:hypothetical protein